MKLYTPEGSELMQVESIDVVDGKLLVRGQIMGAMPMMATVAPVDLRAGLKLVSVGKIWRILMLMCRGK